MSDLEKLLKEKYFIPPKVYCPHCNLDVSHDIEGDLYEESISIERCKYCKKKYNLESHLIYRGIKTDHYFED